MHTHRRLLPSLALFVLAGALPAADALPAPTKALRASSQPAAAAQAADGSPASAWTSAATDGQPWLEIDLTASQRLHGLHLFSGGEGVPPVDGCSVQYWERGSWQDIPSAQIEGNTAAALAVLFDGTVEVTTDRLRLRLTPAKGGVVRVGEVVVWPASAGAVPAIVAEPASAKAPKGAKPAKVDVPLIYLNQSGFNLGKPKRFTAPTLADGTPFIVRPATGGPAVAQGTIQGRIGDFSSFDPQGSAEYVVEAAGLTSVPFRIGMWWLERVTYQNAVDFMIDSRHYLGTHRKPCKGSFGWRDDHHFGWELNTLVPQWTSNPSAYERMPVQVRYEAPANKELWGALAPYPAEAPDIVKLIHWGADVLVTQQRTHEFLKAQLAYFLYAWPSLSTRLPAQNYQVVRDYALANWEKSTADGKYPYDESKDHNLLALKTHIGNTKGAYPPGFSVEPNLLMYAVAKRDGLPNPERFLQAAKAQAEWMVAKLDWNEPQITKGQRMSEFVTMTGLGRFLSDYPQQAPAGLKDSINAWAKVIVRRSDNLWDFRKLKDGDGKGTWTPMDPSSPQKWNEPGNVVGLPAAIYAALPHITDAETRKRLEVIAFAHFDNMFGRNPSGRHFDHRAPQEIEGVETGWYSRLPGGIGQLEKARFVLDGSPKDPLYPYQPEVGNIGWTEGWVQFNTPFNLGLAYLAQTESSLRAVREGARLRITLEAPLNFDAAKAETATVQVTVGGGEARRVALTEASVNDRAFTGTVEVPAGKPAVVTYGYGVFGQQTEVR